MFSNGGHIQFNIFCVVGIHLEAYMDLMCDIVEFVTSNRMKCEGFRAGKQFEVHPADLSGMYEVAHGTTVEEGGERVLGEVVLCYLYC